MNDDVQKRPALFWSIRKASDLPAKDNWLSRAERAHLTAFRFPKRRKDWTLGRWAAKNLLLAHLSPTWPHTSPAAIEIRAARDGAPEPFLNGHPLPLSLSISHASGIAFCAAGPGNLPLGCDIERVEPRSEAFLCDFFTVRELRLINAVPEHARPFLSTLLWSAKESALKAMRRGLREDTRSVEVTFPELGTFGSWHNLLITHMPSKRTFFGWWRRDGTCVETLAATRRAQPVHQGDTDPAQAESSLPGTFFV